MKEIDDNFYLLWGQLGGCLDFLSENYQKDHDAVKSAIEMALRNMDYLNEYLLQDDPEN